MNRLLDLSVKDEELDYIPSALLGTGINCDIKYHVGRDTEEAS